MNCLIMLNLSFVMACLFYAFDSLLKMSDICNGSNGFSVIFETRTFPWKCCMKTPSGVEWLWFDYENSHLYKLQINAPIPSCSKLKSKTLNLVQLPQLLSLLVSRDVDILFKYRLLINPCMDYLIFHTLFPTHRARTLAQINEMIVWYLWPHKRQISLRHVFIVKLSQVYPVEIDVKLCFVNL